VPSSRAEQDCQNDHLNDTPANPGDVRVSRLPIEDLLMDCHWCNVSALAEGDCEPRWLTTEQPDAVARGKVRAEARIAAIDRDLGIDKKIAA
jgi:hypothetical protein